MGREHWHTWHLREPSPLPVNGCRRTVHLRLPTREWEGPLFRPVSEATQSSFWSGLGWAPRCYFWKYTAGANPGSCPAEMTGAGPSPRFYPRPGGQCYTETERFGASPATTACRQGLCDSPAQDRAGAGPRRGIGTGKERPMLQPSKLCVLGWMPLSSMPVCQPEADRSPARTCAQPPELRPVLRTRLRSLSCSRASHPSPDAPPGPGPQAGCIYRTGRPGWRTYDTEWSESVGTEVSGPAAERGAGGGGGGREDTRGLGRARGGTGCRTALRSSCQALCLFRGSGENEARLSFL